MRLHPSLCINAQSLLIIHYEDKCTIALKMHNRCALSKSTTVPSTKFKFFVTHHTANHFRHISCTDACPFARTMEPTSNLTTPSKYLPVSGEKRAHDSREMDEKTISIKHCWSYTLKASDSRRLVAHRGWKNCYSCPTCCLELAKLPPKETNEERIASYKFEEREIKRAKKKAKKEVKNGKQASMTKFFPLSA